MAGRVNLNEVKQYMQENSGNAGFFGLKDDGDTALVRFLIDSQDDLNCTFTHRVKVNGKERNIECLSNVASAQLSAETCPFCAAKKKRQVKMFIPLFDMENDQVLIWERGISYIDQITTEILMRYPEPYKEVFIIQRCGERNNMETVYKFIHQEDSKGQYSKDIELSDFEIPDVYEGDQYLVHKNAEEMEFYLENDMFEDEMPKRRTSHSSNANNEDGSENRGGNKNAEQVSQRRRRFY